MSLCPRRPFRSLKSPLSACWLLISATLLPDTASHAAEKPYPDDPFAADRKLLPATEKGTASGQAQFTALGALISGKKVSEEQDDQPYLGGQLGLEFMLNEFGGLRVSSLQELTGRNGQGLEYRFSSFRIGSALHFNPYRPFDFGTLVEAGVAVVDIYEDDTGDTAPELAVGGFMSWHLDSSWFIRAELNRLWSNVKIDDALIPQHRTAALLGFGIAF